MSIRIQLWRGDTQIGADHIAPDPDPVTGISEGADAIVDALLTAVHKGEHGEGEFRLEADHVDKRWVFLGSYNQAQFSFPKNRQGARVM